MEESTSSSIVMDGRICDIRFNLATVDEIKMSSISDSPISHPSQLMNPFLGLPVESGKCESCGTSDHGKCEGHFGYINLPVPIYHPCHVNELKHILSLLCLKCRKIKKGKILQNQGKKRTTATCSSCQGVPPFSIKEAKTNDGAFYLELKVPSRSKQSAGFWSFLGSTYGFQNVGDSFCRSLLPYEALTILNKIPEETERRLSGKGYHPQNGFVLKCIPVPPNCLSVPDISDGTSIMSSDLSLSMLRKVLNKVDIIKRSRSGFPNFESHEIEANDLQSAVSQYLQLRGTAKAPHDITRKYGVVKEGDDTTTKVWLEKMRTLFIRKGSGFSSRSVITGDAYRGINEIGIPIEIAQKITFEEKVTSHNIKHLQELVDNRLCVTYRDGSVTYAIREGSKGHTYLKVGQIINRRIMDGDIVFINRPPSTHKHSLQAFSVYVHDDHTVKINPLICAPLGADFDGDCVHIFYPQSLAAKAEVIELFSVDKQLVSSHNGSLNLQLVNDSLLSLKIMFRNCFFDKVTAQQLSMHTCPVLPPPALVKADPINPRCSHKGNPCGPFWTFMQVLETVLPVGLDISGERHLIRQSQMLKVDFSRDLIQSFFTEVIASIFYVKGPVEVLKSFSLLQPLLMEILFQEGYSISLNDFAIPKSVIRELKKNIQEMSPLLHHLRGTYNEIVELQVENHLKSFKLPIVSYILKSSALGNLIDSKSDSAINKVIQQLGFLGLQLFEHGKFYSRSLVEDMHSHFRSKYSISGVDYPSEAFVLVRSSFFEGLDPYEELIHSISSREVLIRSSRGLTEPGTLFKNLMAILRDVVICYDGTVRHACGNSVIQFRYGLENETNLGNVCPGDPVGVLAATAISNPAYKAVLDSSQSNNSSWELMKEILLCWVNFKNNVVDRRVILYLNDCFCGKKYCKENAACLVQSHLKRASLRDFAVDIAIEYQKQRTFLENLEDAGLLGHIHFDKTRLEGSNLTMHEILQSCQDVIYRFGKKKSNLSHFFKSIHLSVSEGCCFRQQYDGMCSLQPCLQFTYSGPPSDTIEKASQIMVDAICPILLDTIVKGDPRVKMANIIWIDPETTAWVRKHGKAKKGEVALEVVIEKGSVKQKGDAWRIVLDCCLPVINLIDTRRSIPYGVQQIEELLGISCAFDQSVQRLSESVRMVTKGVLKEHLMLVASSMTCTGSLIGFNSGGYRALFRSWQVQVPFTEATLFRPMKCFERAAEKCHKDSLSSVVASCSWGKHVSLGTGTRFQLLWNNKEMASSKDVQTDVYDFLQLVRTNENAISNACLGADVDDLQGEDGNLSPEHNYRKATFEEDDERNLDWSGKVEKGELSIWEQQSAPEDKSGGWGGWGAKKSDSGDHPISGSNTNQTAKSSEELQGFGSWTNAEVRTQSPGQPDRSNTWGNWKSNDDSSGKAQAAEPDHLSAWDNNIIHAQGSQPRELSKKDVWQSNKMESMEGYSNPSPSTKLDVWGNQNSKEIPPKRSTEISWSNSKSDAWGSQNIKVTATQSSGGDWNKMSDVWGKRPNETHADKSSHSDWNTKFDGSGGESSKEFLTKKPLDGDNWNAKKDVWGSQNAKEVEAVKHSGDDGWNAKSDAWGSQNAKSVQTGKHSVDDGWNSKSDVWGSQNAKSVQTGKHSVDDGWNSKSDVWGSQNAKEVEPVKHSGQDGWNAKSDAWGSQNAKSVDDGCNANSDVWGSQKSKDSQTEKHSNNGGWNSNTGVWGSSDSKETHSGKLVETGVWKSDGSDGWTMKQAHAETPSDTGGWNDNQMPEQLSQPTKSSGWGSSSNAEWKNPKRQFTKSTGRPDDRDGRNANGMLTATGRRMDLFTSEEGQILTEVDQIMQSMKRIMRNSSDGDKLSTADQSFVLDNVFCHHPDKTSKMSDEIECVMIDKHSSFQESRCFYVVSRSGFKADFSYLKCMENYVKVKYPENAEIFCRKYFRKRRPDAQGEQIQT